MKIDVFVKKLLDGEMNKTHAALRLGITRQTLNVRIKKGDWKKGEKAIISGWV